MVEGPAPSRAEFRRLLEVVLADVDADERIGSLLCAAGIRIRFCYPDLDLILDVASTDERDHHIRWSFGGDADWVPKLTLEMNSEVANRYLQGSESLAVAIARRRVLVRGDARIALLYLPAMRLVCEPYRRVVGSAYPHLAIT